MAVHEITPPLTDEILEKLKAGDTVYITGTLYTARDAAHKRLVEHLEAGGESPFPLEGAIIYFVGPSPAKPSQVIGSAGPTTSYRMDAYSPYLHEKGVKGTIGKGMRNQEVKDVMVKTKSIYMAATGGAAALIAKTIKEAEVIAYDELGPEAIRKLRVEKFPATVINDIHGNDLYDEGRKKYEREPDLKKIG